MELDASMKAALDRATPERTAPAAPAFLPLPPLAARSLSEHLDLNLSRLETHVRTMNAALETIVQTYGRIRARGLEPSQIDADPAAFFADCDVLTQQAEAFAVPIRDLSPLVTDFHRLGFNLKPDIEAWAAARDRERRQAAQEAKDRQDRAARFAQWEHDEADRNERRRQGEAVPEVPRPA